LFLRVEGECVYGADVNRRLPPLAVAAAAAGSREGMKAETKAQTVPKGQRATVRKETKARKETSWSRHCYQRSLPTNRLHRSSS
jgi:hypothetical protein